jgi:hypothetical protein
MTVSRDTDTCHYKYVSSLTGISVRILLLSVNHELSVLSWNET